MLIDGIELTDESRLNNLQIAAGAAFPIAPSIGELFYKTSSTEGLHVYDGAQWILTQGGIVNEGSISHLHIQDIGTNTHVQIDSHIANGAIHTDKAVAITAGDTTPGYLSDKLIAGGNIILTVNNSGANETITIGTSAAVGEANTVSNIGSGIGLFKQKTATDFEFKTFTVTNKLSLTDNSSNNTLDFTVNEASLVHDSISGTGINTHIQIDSHLANAAIHFTEGSISHLNIQDRGTNTHPQLDAHVANTLLHFTEASIDHNNILNRGANSHALIDSHIANLSIHTDQKVKVSSADTSAATLENKLVGGTNVTVAKINSGSNEQLVISAPGGSGAVTVSTLSPSGGSDGDVWYKV